MLWPFCKSMYVRFKQTFSYSQFESLRYLKIPFSVNPHSKVVLNGSECFWEF